MEPEEIIDYFNYKHNPLLSSWSKIICSNDIESMEKILLKSVNSPLPLIRDSERGWTILHIAASLRERTHCLVLILEYADTMSIDINAKTATGESALSLACYWGCEENVCCLLEHECDPNVYDVNGVSPLHVAATKSNTKIVEYLIDYNANVDKIDRRGRSPFHVAAEYGQASVCKILLQRGVDPEIQDLHGNHPLHIASLNGHTEVLRTMINHDAGLINKMNYGTKTPVMCAVARNQMSCVEYLLTVGANVSLPMVGRFIPLYIAAYNGNSDMVNILFENTSMAAIEECFRDFNSYLTPHRDVFHSITCSFILTESVNCLNILFRSDLRQSLLEAPQVYLDHTVASPLSFLFSKYSHFDNVSDKVIFEQLLQSLLDRGIIYVENFTREFEIQWPHNIKRYENPFQASCIKSPTQVTYLEKLMENNITVDYSLICYGNMETKFDDLMQKVCLPQFYTTLCKSLRKEDVAVLKFYLRNSAVLEPHHILIQLHVELSKSYPAGSDHSTDKNLLYLKTLIPPSTFRELQNKYYLFENIEVGPCINLKMLCRATVRNQLRDDTLRGNLNNFRHKIDVLTLPVSVKKYLLFT